MGRWLHNGDLKLEPRSTPPTDTVHMSYACIYLFASSCFFFPRRAFITPAVAPPEDRQGCHGGKRGT